jgi:hypothetical protein
MTGPLENVLRNHNVWFSVCHGLLAGYKLAIGSLAEAAAYLAFSAIHALGAREELKRPPPGQWAPIRPTPPSAWQMGAAASCVASTSS